MPGSTPVYGLRYLELGDAPNIAKVGKDLAEDVEAELARIDADTTSLDSRVDALEINGRRIGRSSLTANSAAITTETQVQTVTATLVSGRVYQVTWHPRVVATVAADISRLRIRENNVAGTVLQMEEPVHAIANRKARVTVVCEFTAISSASKTFSLTLERALGSGNQQIFAGANDPVLAFIDEIR